MSFIFITFAILSTLMFYFLPSSYGLDRKKNAKSIFLLNLFLGWTVVGWIAALIWAKKDTK